MAGVYEMLESDLVMVQESRLTEFSLLETSRDSERVGNKINFAIRGGLGRRDKQRAHIKAVCLYVCVASKLRGSGLQHRQGPPTARSRYNNSGCS